MPAEAEVPSKAQPVNLYRPAIRAARSRTMTRLPLHVDAIQEHADGTHVVHCEIYGYRVLIPDLVFEELCVSGSEFEDAEDDDTREVDDEPEQDDHAGEEYGI